MSIETIRSQLKEKYEAFVKKWGYLNSNKNKKVILEDPDGFLICSSLEVKESHQVYRPADILYKSRYTPVEKYTTDDVRQGLLYVLSMTGRVDMSLLQTVVDLDEDEIVRELGDMLYWSPINNCWEESSKFLAGNVVHKLEQCEQVLSKLKSQPVEEVEEPEPEEVDWKSNSSKLEYKHPRPWRKGK